MKQWKSTQVHWQGPRNVLLSLAILLITQACVSTDSDLRALKPQIDKLYPDQSEEIRDFFAVEAHRAGVKNIREIRAAETAKKIDSQESGCGFVRFDDGQILINVQKPQCLRLAHLAHEIAHIGVVRLNCFGHGDKFYEYNLGIARRFEEQFPAVNDRGGWGSPVRSVENRSRYYRSDAEFCV